jgi:hypothetical protein
MFQSSEITQKGVLYAQRKNLNRPDYQKDDANDPFVNILPGGEFRPDFTIAVFGWLRSTGKSTNEEYHNA